MQETLLRNGSDSLFALLRRFRVPVLVGCALGLVIGYLVHQTTRPTWTAQVTVELPLLRDRIDLNPIGDRGDVLSADTDAQIVLSDPVVRAVSAADGSGAAAVRASLQVTARPLSRILLISYTSPSAEGARTGAAAAGSAFLRERERAYLEPQREFLQEVMRGTESVVPDFDEVIPPATVPSAENLRRRSFVQVLTLAGAGRVVAGPRMTSVSDRGDIEVPLTSGFATGGLGGLVLALLLPTLRRRQTATRPLDARPPRRRLRPPSRRRVLAGGLVVTTVVTTVIAAAAVVVVPQQWTALAIVYVPPLVGNAYASRGSVIAVGADLGTEAELVRSDRVLDAVSAAPGVDATADQLRGRIRTTPSNRGETVEISVNGGTSAGTEQIARLVAQESVLVRQERALRWTTEQRTELGAALSTAESALESALETEGQEGLVNGYNRRLTLLRADARGLDGSSTEQGAVLSTRASPSRQSTVLLLGVVAGGFVLGLLVGAGTHGATRAPFTTYRPRRPTSVMIQGPSRA